MEEFQISCTIESVFVSSTVSIYACNITNAHLTTTDTVFVSLFFFSCRILYVLFLCPSKYYFPGRRNCFCAVPVILMSIFVYRIIRMMLNRNFKLMMPNCSNFFFRQLFLFLTVIKFLSQFERILSLSLNAN